MAFIVLPTYPSLRSRLPLYPGRFVAGVVMVSLGPLLDPIMRDLRVSFSRGGLIAAAFFLGQIAGVLPGEGPGQVDRCARGPPSSSGSRGRRALCEGPGDASSCVCVRGFRMGVRQHHLLDVGPVSRQGEDRVGHPPHDLLLCGWDDDHPARPWALDRRGRVLAMDTGLRRRSLAHPRCGIRGAATTRHSRSG